MSNIQDTQKFKMRLLLDAAKGSIINSIEQLMSDKNLETVTFTVSRMEPFSQDDENAFMREVICLDKDGTITYEVTEHDSEYCVNWNDADTCPYSLNWMLGQIEEGNYEEVDEDR